MKGERSPCIESQGRNETGDLIDDRTTIRDKGRGEGEEHRHRGRW